jgi:hypothetical protein
MGYELHETALLSPVAAAPSSERLLENNGLVMAIDVPFCCEVSPLRNGFSSTTPLAHPIQQQQQKW